MKYLFRREDNGEIVEVSFMEMMQQDQAGFITLDNGVMARRCTHLEEHDRSNPVRDPQTVDAWNRPVVSDALGFHDSQFEHFEADRKANGFSAIEFRKDPHGFGYQTVCHSPEQWRRYVKHRGLIDKNGEKSTKLHLSEEDLRRAKDLVQRVHG